MSAEKFVSASKVIPMLKCLEEYLTKIEPAHEITRGLKTSLLTELSKRFKDIEKVHLFSSATFLDSRFKKIHLTDGMALAKTINYVKRQTNTAIDIDETPGNTLPTPAMAAIDGDIWQAHNQILSSSSRAGDSRSELDLYIATPIANLKDDPLKSWQDLTAALPNLSKLAMKHLQVPASSAPAERLFSKAGNILRKKRSRILGKRLQKLLFLSNFEL